VERIRLSLLGGFELRLPDGRLADLRTRKTEALVAILAYRPGELFQREQIAAILLGDRNDRQGRHSVSQALTLLRRAVPDSNGLIQIRRDSIAIDPDLVDVDVVSFERLDSSDDRDALRQAAALYRGPLPTSPCSG
jgi:DNA-binding SARP family transcriptional activator